MDRSEFERAILENQKQILNELKILNHNIERLFTQGYAVDGPKEAATTRALEFAQYMQDLRNASCEDERKKIEKAWNRKRKAEMKKNPKN